MGYISANADNLQYPRIDIAKVEIKLFKKKYRNYCFLIFICYGIDIGFSKD